MVFVFLQVLYAFAIGIAFAVVLYKTKSILPCMAIHAVVDFLGSFELKPILIPILLERLFAVYVQCTIIFFKEKIRLCSILNEIEPILAFTILDAQPSLFCTPQIDA